MGFQLEVGGNLWLDEGFRATGRGKSGAVDLRQAHITGDLSLSGAKLTNEDGSALKGFQLQVGGNLWLDEKFRATGRGEDGAVFLMQAHISRGFYLSGAELINETGPALDGFRLQVDDSLRFGAGFRATGHGENGAVSLTQAHIGETLYLSGAELTHAEGRLLGMEGAVVKEVSLSARVICPQELRGQSKCESTTCKINLINLLDFTYVSFEGADWDQWLHLISCHTSEYQSQPYQQLAAVQSAAGKLGDVREIP